MNSETTSAKTSMNKNAKNSNSERPKKLFRNPRPTKMEPESKNNSPVKSEKQVPKVPQKSNPSKCYPKKNDRFTNKPVEHEKQEVIANVNSKFVVNYTNSKNIIALSECAKILNLGDDFVNHIEITDVNENLCLVNYINDQNPDVYGKIRGVTIDLESKSVIADSFGFTRVVNFTGQKLEADNGVMNFQFDDSPNQEIKLDNLNFSRFFDGVNMRIIYHKHKMYMLSRRKIDTSRSYWRIKKYFPTIFQQAGGPKVNELFDTNYPYSSTCYDVVVCDQELAISSRLKIKKPFVILVDEREMKTNRPDDQITKGILRTSGFKIKTTMNFESPESGFYELDNMTLDEVNQFLDHGYHSGSLNSDQRLRFGESIIAYTKDSENRVDFLVRITSSAIQRSIKFRDNNSDIENQYSKLVAKYINPKTKDQYYEEMITFKLIDNDSLISNIEEKGYYDPEIEVLTSERQDEIFNDLALKERLIWLNFLFTIPPHLQIEACKNHRYEFSQINNLIPKYIIGIFVRACMNRNEIKLYYPSEKLLDYLVSLIDRTGFKIKFVLHQDARKLVSRQSYWIHFIFLKKEEIENYTENPDRNESDVLSDSSLKKSFDLLKTIVNKEAPGFSDRIKGDITRMIKRDGKRAES